MTPPRRAKLVLLVLAVALVGLGVWRGEAVYWWVMTTKPVFEDLNDRNHTHCKRGFVVRYRWSGDLAPGVSCGWYLANGLKAWEDEWTETGQRIRRTVWQVDGTVWYQDLGLVNTRRSPPWLWGVTDQTSPTMPDWMKDDAQWQAALDAQE